MYSKKDGLMEFVAGSSAVSKVLADHGQSILAYLRTHNPDPQVTTDAMTRSRSDD
jgi:hypothetical protein